MKWVLRIAGGFVAVLLLAVVVLLILGRRADAGQMNTSIEIAASPEKIWPWLNEPGKLKQWVSWLVEVRGPEDRSVGSKQVWVMQDMNNGGMLMQIEGDCVGYDPPRRLAVSLNTAGMFDGEQTYDLTPVAEGRTRLDMRSRYHFQIWFAQLMEPLVMPSARKKMVADLAQLKARVESAP